MATFKVKKAKVNEDDSDEFIEISAESIGTDMMEIGIKLDPVTDHIPRFRLCLPTINFTHLIVKGLFYMMSEQNSEVLGLLTPLSETST